MERDVQNFAPKAYAQSVPLVADDQHRVLLSSLESHLSGKDAPTLLVFECGGEVLPYSFQYQDGSLGGSNVDRVQAMIRDGHIILVDVTDSRPAPFSSWVRHLAATPPTDTRRLGLLTKLE